MVDWSSALGAGKQVLGTGCTTDDGIAWAGDGLLVCSCLVREIGNLGHRAQ